MKGIDVSYKIIIYVIISFFSLKSIKGPWPGCPAHEQGGDKDLFAICYCFSLFRIEGALELIQKSIYNVY